MNISYWLDKKRAQRIDVSQIEVPADMFYDEDPDEMICFEENKPCGYCL